LAYLARVDTPSTDPRMTDAGLYGPGSEAWRLNREAMLLLGAGPRALLLQIAHPAVAAGVNEHSDFRADPWRRLSATVRSYLTIVYGTTRAARAEIRRLNALHRRISGPGYSARDPELALWVHATLIDSTIVANDAWIEPLSMDRRAAFYAETRPIGRAFGVPDDILPRDLDAFEVYVDSMLGQGGPIAVSDTARELGQAVLRPPLSPLAPLLPFEALARTVLSHVPVAMYGWTLWPAVGLLPGRIRDAYGLAWGWREQVIAGWLVAVWRAWRPWLPEEFRQMPQALAADRRIGEDDRRGPVSAPGEPTGRRPEESLEPTSQVGLVDKAKVGRDIS
jgi:uncharacterized protein (DUF2236 family)